MRFNALFLVPYIALLVVLIVDGAYLQHEQEQMKAEHLRICGVEQQINRVLSISLYHANLPGQAKEIEKLNAAVGECSAEK
jgi:hypothetical protein